MLFHIEVDIIRHLHQKFENRKNIFWIFPFLTIYLTVAFKGLYRRHKMTTIWAFLSDMMPMCNNTLRYRPWSSEELFRSIFYVSNIQDSGLRAIKNIMFFFGNMQTSPTPEIEYFFENRKSAVMPF